MTFIDPNFKEAPSADPAPDHASTPVCHGQFLHREIVERGGTRTEVTRPPHGAQSANRPARTVLAAVVANGRATPGYENGRLSRAKAEVA